MSKSVMAVSLGTFILAGVVAARLGYTSSGPPVIVFEGPTYDFGTAYQDEVVNHIYTFRNRGKSDLKIENTKTSCGCTAVVKSRDVIPPGETGEIEVNYSVRKARGASSKTITVFSNDPQNPSIQLVIKGQVLTAYETDPATGSIRFAPLVKGQKAVQTFRIQSSAKSEFRVLSVTKQNQNPRLSTSVEDAPRNGIPGQLIRIELDGDEPLGRFSDKLVVVTDLDRAQTITIPIYGEVVGPLEATPRNVRATFRDDSSNEISQIVRIQRRDRKSLRLVRAESGAQNVRVVIKKNRASKDPAEVEVVVQRDEVKTNGTTRIKVYTDDEEQSVIEIPVTWAISRAGAVR